MKYYIIAGEASGDLHGSNLISSIRKKDPEAEIRCWGGDKMKNAGATLVEHYKNIAFMGFWEVIKNLPLILKKIAFCRQDIKNFKPDAVVLVDYPGFNLRIARFVHDLGIPQFYYISPQIWAWKESRIHKIKKFIDRMIVILPFEKDFYKKWDVDVDYVGHPLADVIEDFPFQSSEQFKCEYGFDEKPLIALLPGSRKQEIEKMLKEMLQMPSLFPDYRFVIAGLHEVDREFYDRLIKDFDVSIIFDNTYNLVKHSEAALVTSGTATLETTLIGTPQVVCYKGSYFSYAIGKMLVKVKYIAMPNLILDKPFLPELIQGELNRNKLKYTLNNILSPERREGIIENYELLKIKLKSEGASDKAGSIIVNYLHGEKK